MSRGSTRPAACLRPRSSGCARATTSRRPALYLARTGPVEGRLMVSALLTYRWSWASAIYLGLGEQQQLFFCCRRFMSGLLVQDVDGDVLVRPDLAGTARWNRNPHDVAGAVGGHGGRHARLVLPEPREGDLVRAARALRVHTT